MLGGVGSTLIYPRLILVVNNRFPNAVPDELLYWVATPLPTALPAPMAVSNNAQLSLIGNQLADLQPTATATASSIATLPPTSTPHPQTSISTQTATSLPPTPTPLVTPSPTATPLPVATSLQNINVIPQKFNNCGPANVTITLNYFGHTVEQLEVGDIVKPNYDDRNVSPWELVDYVNKHTPMQARYFVGGDIDLLKQLLAAGYPVIIEKGLYPNSWEGWMGHYLTVVGYDDVGDEENAGQVFISLDTFLGPWDSSGRRDSYEFVDEFWQQFNHTFILLYPPEEEGKVLAILPPELDDEILMWRETAVSNQQLTRQQPQNPYGWFNLGSSLTHLARLSGNHSLYESAAAAFDEARIIGLPWRMLWYQFEPYEAYLANGRLEDVFILSDAILTTEGGQNVEETYLYRAQAFSQMGNEAASEDALAHARLLNPTMQR